MTNQNKAIALIAIISLAAGAGVAYWLSNKEVNETGKVDTQVKPTANKTVQKGDPRPVAPTKIIGTKRPSFKLKDTDDELRDISEFDGKVVMINFWATWCPPCVREIPAFIKLYDKYKDQGLEIVGVALDEKQAAIDFVDPMGINYPILIGELEGINISKDYGNRLGVLPYTVIVDREGKIIYADPKELSFEEAEAKIKSLL